MKLKKFLKKKVHVKNKLYLFLFILAILFLCSIYVYSSTDLTEVGTLFSEINNHGKTINNLGELGNQGFFDGVGRVYLFLFILGVLIGLLIFLVKRLLNKETKKEKLNLNKI